MVRVFVTGSPLPLRKVGITGQVSVGLEAVELVASEVEETYKCPTLPMEMTALARGVRRRVGRVFVYRPEDPWRFA